MVKITGWNDPLPQKYTSIYCDYPIHPYCSPERSVYSYSKELKGHMRPFIPVVIEAMEQLPNGLLLGHIKLLWRINMETWTTKTKIPSYFEYEYGVNVTNLLVELEERGLIYFEDGFQTLNLLKVPDLKHILKLANFKTTGKKKTLIERTTHNVSSELVKEHNPNKKYILTMAGKELFENYQDFIWAFELNKLYSYRYYIKHNYKDLIALKNTGLSLYDVEKKLISDRITESLEFNQYSVLRNLLLSQSRLEKKNNNSDQTFLFLSLTLLIDESGLANALFATKKSIIKTESAKVQKNQRLSLVIVSEWLHLLSELKYQQLDLKIVGNNIWDNFGILLYQTDFNSSLDVSHFLISLSYETPAYPKC